MRSVGSELLSAAVALALPVGMLGVFPFDAFRFKATDGGRCPSSAAFVRLTPAAERQALQVVRASWQKKGDGVRRLQVDLFCAELPEDAPVSVLTVRDRCPPPPPGTLACEWGAFPPSLQAPPPLPIKVEPAADPLAFPREDLLKLN